MYDVGVSMSRVEGFFDPTHHGWVKKNTTQPNPPHKSNPTHMGQVEPMGWTNLFYYYYILLNWVEKKININILKKTQRLVSM